MLKNEVDELKQTKVEGLSEDPEMRLELQRICISHFDPEMRLEFHSDPYISYFEVLLGCRKT